MPWRNRKPYSFLVFLWILAAKHRWRLIICQRVIYLNLLLRYLSKWWIHGCSLDGPSVPHATGSWKHLEHFLAFKMGNTDLDTDKLNLEARCSHPVPKNRLILLGWDWNPVELKKWRVADELKVIFFESDLAEKSGWCEKEQIVHKKSITSMSSMTLTSTLTLTSIPTLTSSMTPASTPSRASTWTKKLNAGTQV